LNNGTKIKPVIDRVLEEKINYLQTELSYKELYSNSWYKLKNQIDKLKEKRTNRLKD
jgi:transposase